MPDLIPPDPTPASVSDFLVETADQFLSIQFNMIAMSDLLNHRIRKLAPDIRSVPHDGQLRMLFSSIVRDREARRVALLEQICAMAKRVETAEAAVPSNDSVLMEHITGISAKVSSLVDQWHKGQASPPQPNGIFASIHAPNPDKNLTGGKGKKCPATPAIFGKEQPTKQQALVNEAQRVQDPYAILRDWDWEKISAISPLMKACNSHIPAESALAITKVFEFCTRGTPAQPTPVPMGLYTTATAAPAAPAGQPQGHTTSPTKPQPLAHEPSAHAKPKAPVVHVPAPRDQTKLLQ
ncbi:hypothetical protein BC835DRAFT_1311290, partial [Cytidiella melzeri]